MWMMKNNAASGLTKNNMTWNKTLTISVALPKSQMNGIRGNDKIGLFHSIADLLALRW